jgi:putative salt-induced outer membrane protein YdiY
MRYLFLLGLCAGLAQFSLSCHASRQDIMSSLYAADVFDEVDQKTKPGFTMEGQLGVVLTTGNTQGSSVNGRLTADHETENWSNRYLVESLYTRSQRTDRDEPSRTTAQRFNASIEADYKLLDPHERIFIFGHKECGSRKKAPLDTVWGLVTT